MMKHQWWESIKSFLFFQNHNDPKKDDQLKENKIEIDDKVKKDIKAYKRGRFRWKWWEWRWKLEKSTNYSTNEGFSKNYQSFDDQYNNHTKISRKKKVRE